MKNKFIESELWYLSLSGAFQRNNVYQKQIDDKNGEKKKAFKKKLRESIIYIVKQYNEVIDDDKHIANIENLIADNKNEILVNGKLNFGTAQKILNLYLKYLWCTERISHLPPHCPVDRVILKELSKYKTESWTKMENEIQYMNHINALRELAKKEHLSLAEWELLTYSKLSEKK
jgi:hypothetical protein